MKSSTKVKANLASLPPTQGAAEQHSFTVYLQTQQWLHNDSLNPARWVGYETMVESSTPCGCRKAGIHCSSVCGYDGACMNSAHIRKEDMEEDFMDFEDMTEL
ncbi:hypothetical protein PR048_002254 [Dryococelus australis]|uniref:Uncharacterized protein n=1 Tax=Dryococelus australis TaxID=614101 RepID=A0ABQ9IJN6_9NEOP|nr:hypothetical protein PR048_002254 [Dryococelus australis]